MNTENQESEELIGGALYLLQLCQQDLNMGRRETIWARASRARQLCEALEKRFEPNANFWHPLTNCPKCGEFRGHMTQTSISQSQPKASHY